MLKQLYATLTAMSLAVAVATFLAVGATEHADRYGWLFPAGLVSTALFGLAWGWASRKS